MRRLCIVFALVAAVIAAGFGANAQTIVPGSLLPLATPTCGDVAFGIHGGTLGVGGTTSKFLFPLACATASPTPSPSPSPSPIVQCGTAQYPFLTGSNVSGCTNIIGKLGSLGQFIAYLSGYTQAPTVTALAFADSSNILSLLTAPTTSGFTIASSSTSDSALFNAHLSVSTAVTPGPVTTPTPTAVPMSYATFVPVAMGALADNAQGFDIGAAGGVVGTATHGNYNFQALQTAVAARQIRGIPNSASGFPTPNAYFNSLVNTTNINNSACFSFSTNTNQNGASQTATMISTGGSGGVLGSIQGGTYSASAWQSNPPPCVIEEGQNEANANIYVQSTTLSAAVTSPNTAVTENVPSGASTTCSTPQGSTSGYYSCVGAWLYVSDGGSSEYVQVSSIPSAGTWQATFTHTHSVGTTVTIDPNWVEAGWQYAAWENLYNNSSHPEFANILLTTIPLSYIYSASESAGTIVPYDAAMVALSQQVGLCPSGCHLWQTPPGFTEPLSYSLNFHTSPQYYYVANAPSSSSLNQWREVGLAMQQLYCTGGWSGNTCSGTQATPLYSWKLGFYCGECLFATGADFGTGSANVPYVPAGTNFTDLPQTITATYIASEHYLMASTFAAITGQMPQIIEPIPNCGASGTLNNWYLDCSPNPVPAMYSVANTAPFFYDSTYNASTFTPETLAFADPTSGDLCVTIPTLTTFTFGPNGCTTYQVVSESQDSTTYTVLFHRIPPSYALYPQIAATAGPCPVSPNGYGQCPNQPAPSPIPAPTTTNYTLANPVVINGSRIPIASIQQARVYHQSTTCDIPTNVAQVAPYATPTPDPTPSPNYVTAGNSTCYAYTPTGYYTTNAGGISIPFPADTSATLVVMSTNLNTPIPIMTPIPMWTPVATPTPGPSGPLPYNYMRNGVYSPNVAH